MKAPFEIANNEEKISNSSTPLENEKLRHQSEREKDKDRIELEFEMTQE